MARRTKASATRLMNAFDYACQEMAFKGSQHPDDWDSIEARYHKAREKMFIALLVDNEGLVAPKIGTRTDEFAWKLQPNIAKQPRKRI